MKKYGIIFLFTLFLVASCTFYVNENTDEDTLVNLNNLPYNLIININLNEVSSPEHASVYAAGYHKFCKDRVIDSLIRGDIVEIEQMAVGPWIKAEGTETTEYITIYNEIIKGGLLYTLYKNDRSLTGDIEAIFPNETGRDSLTQQLQGYSMRENYQRNIDLYFMRQYEAVEKVMSALYNTGFPNIELEVSYSLDVTVLSSQYLQHMSNERLENVPLVTFTKEDEVYYFQFRQIVNGIPLSNVLWEEGTRTNQGAETIINVFLSESGIESIYSVGLVTLHSEGVENRLLSKEQVINLLIKEYTGLIIQSENRVEEMELCYIVISSSEGLILTPAWVLLIESDAIWDDPLTGVLTPVTEYRYLVFNAITGEIIRKAS